jgi:uncharacterized membrane protein YgaE (UPF0421/DUF939 family)
MNTRYLKRALQLSVRAALATGVSVAIAQWLGVAFPIAALISAVIVTDVDPPQTRHLALRRLFGTIVGALIGTLIGPAGPVGVGVGVAAAMLLAQIVGLTPAAKLAGYVCGIVVLSSRGGPLGTALQRMLETVVGIGVAVLVSFLPKLLRIEDDLPAEATHPPSTPTNST